MKQQKQGVWRGRTALLSGVASLAAAVCLTTVLPAGYAAPMATATVRSGAFTTTDKLGPRMAKPVITTPEDHTTVRVGTTTAVIPFGGTGEPDATLRLSYRPTGGAWKTLDADPDPDTDSASHDDGSGFAATVGADGHWHGSARFTRPALDAGNYDFQVRQTLDGRTLISPAIRLTVHVVSRELHWDTDKTDTSLIPGGTAALAGWSTGEETGPVEVTLRTKGASAQLGRFDVHPQQDGRATFSADDVHVPDDATPGPATLRLTAPEVPGNHVDLPVTVRPAPVSGIRTLGYANRFAIYDDEFRYDAVVTVPKGAKIKNISYAFYGNDVVNMVAWPKPQGQLGTAEEYTIVDTTHLGTHDALTIHLQGDLSLRKDVCPKAGLTYPVKINVTLDDGEVLTTSPKVDVLGYTRCPGDPDGTAPPYARLPWDASWGGLPYQYSQAGFGYVSQDGKLPTNTVFIDAVNPRQVDPKLSCSKTDLVYYQWVREDGTPSRLTPEPVPLPFKGHWEDSRNATYVLPAQDFKKAGDEPGYYKFLVWPQATNTDGSACAHSWDPAKPGDAFQIGSVFYAYKGSQDYLTAATAPAPASAGDGKDGR